jgi:hypothetical protein
VLISVSSLNTSASSHDKQIRLTTLSLQCNFHRGQLSGLQSFLYVQTCILARPSDCTYQGVLPQQPGLIHHAIPILLPRWVVASLRDRIRIIVTAGLPPAGLEPCRPLPCQFWQTLPYSFLAQGPLNPIKPNLRLDNETMCIPMPPYLPAGQKGQVGHPLPPP